MNNTMSEREKNTLDGINFKLDTAGEKMSKLEDIALATTQNETQRGKRQGEKRNRESFPCFPYLPVQRLGLFFLKGS